MVSATGLLVCVMCFTLFYNGSPENRYLAVPTSLSSVALFWALSITDKKPELGLLLAFASVIILLPVVAVIWLVLFYMPWYI